MNKNKCICDCDSDYNNTIHVCIPCLREQNIICTTLDNLSKATNKVRTNVKFYVVTTKKEDYEKTLNRSSVSDFAKHLYKGASEQYLNEKFGELFDTKDIEFLSHFNTNCGYKELEERIFSYYDNKKSTYDIVKDYIVNHKEIDITLLSYPNIESNMAKQLNYCYEWIIKNNNNLEKDFFMSYNADCVPNISTFEILLKCIKNNQDVKVFQLIRSYTVNYNNYKGIFNGFLKASALYQTRWSLGFEYPMYKHFNKIKKYNYGGYYLIGHGMTLSFEILNKINGFNENTYLEDMYAGYALSCLKEPIIAVPTLENTLNPTTVSSLFKQKMVWFSGMCDVINYPKFFSESTNEPFNQKRYEILKWQFYIRDCIAWLLGSGITGVFLLLSIFANKFAFILSVLIFLSNIIINSFILPYYLNKLNVLDDYRNLDIRCFFGMILYSIFRNIPCIFYVIFRNKSSMKKYKTSR